jgi:hypothetical protein
MSVPLLMSLLRMSATLPTVISSPASAAGRMRCVWPAGPMTDLFGQAVAPVSRSARRGQALAPPIRAIFGRPGSGSSASAALQLSLASRLRALMDSRGSTLFRLTWKVRTTPSGRQICARRASARRTSDSACTSWPTPNAGPQNDTDTTWEARREACKAKHGNNGFGMTVGMAAQLAAWPTPKAEDSESTGAHRGTPDTLTSASRLASWATPTTRDQKNSGGDGSNPRDLPRQTRLAAWATPTARDMRSESASDEFNAKRFGHTRGKPLSAEVLLTSGPPALGSPAATAKPDPLNPAHSRWLQGYPVAWDASAATAIASSPKSRKRS